MKDIKPAEMESLLQFVYQGEVEIPNTDVERIINISVELGIAGLSEIKSKEQDDVGRRNTVQARRRLESPHKSPTAKMAKIEPEHYKGNDFIESNDNKTNNKKKKL